MNGVPRKQGRQERSAKFTHLTNRCWIFITTWVRYCVNEQNRKIWSKISCLLANILAEWDDQWKIWGSEIYTMLHADISNGEKIRKQKWVVLMGASLIVSSVTRVGVRKERTCRRGGTKPRRPQGSRWQARKAVPMKVLRQEQAWHVLQSLGAVTRVAGVTGQWVLGTWGQAGKGETVDI